MMLEIKKSLNDIKKVIYFAIGIFVLVYVYLERLFGEIIGKRMTI